VAESKKPRRPATTPEARENQLVSLAVDLVEKRLIDGTASAQETVFYLKLGSPRERLERTKLELENQLTKAKTDQIASEANREELFADAIKAMMTYKGERSEE